MMQCTVQDKGLECVREWQMRGILSQIAAARGGVATATCNRIPQIVVCVRHVVGTFFFFFFPDQIVVTHDRAL